MKKLISVMSLVLVCALFSRPCISQIEIVAGLVKSSITGGESWKDPIGPQVGAIIHLLNINDNISLRGEGNISFQGARWEESVMSGRMNLIYLNFPFVLRYQHESGIFGEAGLQPGLLLMAKDKYGEYSENVMDHMKKLDIGIPVEVGYQVNDKISAGIRVIPGITDITDDDAPDRNLVFIFRLTYLLGLK